MIEQNKVTTHFTLHNDEVRLIMKLKGVRAINQTSLIRQHLVSSFELAGYACRKMQKQCKWK